MKRLLRSFVNWLDRKFPDQVVVSVARYNEMETELKKTRELLEKYDTWAKKTDERLTKIETEMGRINTTLGFASLQEKFKLTPFTR